MSFVSPSQIDRVRTHISLLWQRDFESKARDEHGEDVMIVRVPCTSIFNRVQFNGVHVEEQWVIRDESREILYRDMTPRFVDRDIHDGWVLFAFLPKERDVAIMMKLKWGGR